MCFASFATNYISEKADVKYDIDDLENYMTQVQDVEENLDSERKEVITLKNKLGKMRKRARPIVIRSHNVSKFTNPNDNF